MKLVGLIGTLLVILLMTACANQPPPSEETWDGSLSLPQQKAMGFVVGLFHGFVAPFAFIGSLFADVRIYAFPNAGRWYDLGFLLGLSAWGGGGAVAVKKAP